MTHPLGLIRRLGKTGWLPNTRSLSCGCRVLEDSAVDRASIFRGQGCGDPLLHARPSDELARAGLRSAPSRISLRYLLFCRKQNAYILDSPRCDFNHILFRDESDVRKKVVGQGALQASSKERPRRILATPCPVLSHLDYPKNPVLCGQPVVQAGRSLE